MQSFQEFSLSPEVARAIQELGFESPTPIQAQTLPKLLGATEGTDFLGLAATGTGKTAAFAIPLIEQVDPSIHGVQAVVLCPTRELAVQVAGQINLLGKYKRVRALPIYGGAAYGDQIRGLRDGASIVVATPGRLVDHLTRGTAKLSKVRTVVLDEADEMISMGFKEDLEAILLQVDESQRKTWLFSATMSPEVRRIADRFLDNPESVQINKAAGLSGTVEQTFYVVKEMDKPEILEKLIDFADDFYGLVFCQTKSLVIDLTDQLSRHGYPVDCLHGDMDQKARDRAMRSFRDRTNKILVCTDVACRGLDVQDLTHVVNYSLPRELDHYVHRIGRTGRSGKSGSALSLVTPSHMPLVTKIEKMTKSKMTKGQIPNRKEVTKKKIAGALGTFQAVDPTRALEVIGTEWTTAIEAMDKTEIVARFLGLKFADMLAMPSKEVETKNEVLGARERRGTRPSPSGSMSVPKPLERPAAPRKPLIQIGEGEATTGVLSDAQIEAVAQNQQPVAAQAAAAPVAAEEQAWPRAKKPYGDYKKRDPQPEGQGFGGGEKRGYGKFERGGFGAEKRGFSKDRGFGGERGFGAPKRGFGGERSYGGGAAAGGEKRGYGGGFGSGEKRSYGGGFGGGEKRGFGGGGFGGGEKRGFGGGSERSFGDSAGKRPFGGGGYAKKSDFKRSWNGASGSEGGDRPARYKKGF